jgi:hypothetical protein
MFLKVPLSIIRSFRLYTQHWYMSYKSRIRMELSSILILVASCQQTIPLLCVQWKTPADGQRKCPKHVVSFQEYIWEISASSCFYYKEFSTMHGHMNVKFFQVFSTLFVLGTKIVHVFGHTQQTSFQIHASKLTAAISLSEDDNFETFASSRFVTSRLIKRYSSPSTQTSIGS